MTGLPWAATAECGRCGRGARVVHGADPGGRWYRPARRAVRGDGGHLPGLVEPPVAPLSSTNAVPRRVAGSHPGADAARGGHHGPPRRRRVHAGLAVGHAHPAPAADRRPDPGGDRRALPASAWPTSRGWTPRSASRCPSSWSAGSTCSRSGSPTPILEVATANPFDIDAEKMLAFATGREVRMLLVVAGAASARSSTSSIGGDDVVSKLLGGHRDRRRRAADRGRSRRRRRLARTRRASAPIIRLVDMMLADGIDQPGQRHPRRAGRGRRRGALPHRRRAAAGHEDPAQRRRAAHLAHQDHVGARHRRPAAAAGRARPRRR